ncbi:hypothetical protein KUTeg_018303 [Tegillarca granosa]|uniref:RNA helicase n=1 Tax=Tegillarca granosa TaxID=220873 RepID=A0ABQ9EMG0_TEGGR|nr:hypothetical protein KUTeg_018303 [Tegillarca granosa]
MLVELEFPSSLTATERAYVHRMVESMGIKSKSRGKKESTMAHSSATFQLVKNSRQQINSVLQRFPLTNKERQELQPRTDRSQINEVSRELNKTTIGKLNNGVAQIPPRRGDSDLKGFRESLPVFKYWDEIMFCINNNQVTLISGETGSGKTTQVPQMILDECHTNGRPCRIICTQPRRIAALSVAERVAAERAERIGQTVGYQIRLESKVSPKTLLTFCTTGVLLRTLMGGGDRALTTVTHIIVDEIHERDRFSDFLLISLREVILRYRHLKVVLMSASLNTELFVRYFNNCPVVSGGTMYTNKDMDKQKKEMEKAARQQKHLSDLCSKMALDGGEPDHKDDIEDLEYLGQEKEVLEPWLVKEMDQLLEEIWLSGNEDHFSQIFHLIMSENVSDTSLSSLMIAAGRGFTDVVEQLLNLGANILSTNIAETSITINDVVFVIDSGKVKEKHFDALLSVHMFKSYWISKASALQRKGRAGRCRPGVCYHLFSSIRYNTLMDYATPEILRHPLQQVDALDAYEDLTELGHHLADLPLEPRLGKMMLYSVVLKCLDPVLTIVCALAYKDPFLLPTQPYQKRASLTARRKFAAETYSDHMALLRAFQAWQRARTDGWEKSFCQNNFISAACMEIIVGLRTQLLGQLRASGFVRARGGGDIRDLNTNSENWAVVKAALCAGMYPNLMYIDRKRMRVLSQKEGNVKFHSTSVLTAPPTGTVKSANNSRAQLLRSIPSDWILYEEITRYERQAFVKCCTVVSPISVALFAGPGRMSPDCVKDYSKGFFKGTYNRPDNSSDSESEDKEELTKTSIQLDEWLNFKVDSETGNLVVNLRQKWHSLFLRRMRAPSKPWSQVDEAVIRAVINVLTNEEQALGLQQPAGIGQRPRPMKTPKGSNTDHHFDSSPGASYTSSTSGSGNNSVRSSAGSTPSGSPKLASQSKPETDSDHPCRYFVIKCNNQKYLDISQSKGIWATNPSNEKKFNKSFQEGKSVHLIFSVQGSGHFQGYAKMTSLSVKEKSPDFNLPGLNCVINVEWIKRANLPFQSTHHLLNPYNENRRVQISRDGQEIEPTVGESLIKQWDRFPNNQRKSQTSSSPSQSKMTENLVTLLQLTVHILHQTVPTSLIKVQHQVKVMDQVHIHILLIKVSNIITVVTPLDIINTITVAKQGC